MSRSWFALTAAGFLAATIASGWLHGTLANRWGQGDALTQAAAKLGSDLPPRLGPWRLVKTLKMESDVRKSLQCAAALHGIYTNDQTGDSVIVAVLTGPSGPLSVHTPEICYSAADYELAGQRQEWTVLDKRGQSHGLWTIYASSRHSTRPNLRVVYGWSLGDAWRAVRGPRFALAGVPVVYKLQLTGPARDQQREPALSPGRDDPSHDFLARFLTEIQPRLISTSRRPIPTS
jgi:hypothetical protein